MMALMNNQLNRNSIERLDRLVGTVVEVAPYGKMVAFNDGGNVILLGRRKDDNACFYVQTTHVPDGRLSGSMTFLVVQPRDHIKEDTFIGYTLFNCYDPLDRHMRSVGL